MRFWFKIIPFVFITFLLPSNFVFASNKNKLCKKLFDQDPAHQKTFYATDLEHYVRVADGSFGVGHPEDFLELIHRVGSSTRLIQKEWITISFGKRLWTTVKNGKGIDDGTGFIVFITLKPEFRFYDPILKDPDMQLWKAWLKDNKAKKRTNIFSDKQILDLKKDLLPWHSAFYEEYRFAGYVHRYPQSGGGFSVDEKSAPCILLARSIAKIKVEREFKLDWHEDSKKWPSSWKRKSFSFTPR